MTNPYEPTRSQHASERESAVDTLARRVTALGGTPDEADAVLGLTEDEARAALGMPDTVLRSELLANRREYVHGTEPNDQRAAELVAASYADEAAMVISGPIKAVTAWVGSDKTKAEAALAAEQARGDDARKGLVTFLEGLLGGDPD